jgi:hypothetical protein
MEWLSKEAAGYCFFFGLMAVLSVAVVVAGIKRYSFYKENPEAQTCYPANARFQSVSRNDETAPCRDTQPSQNVLRQG